jgi:hypothetical protein
VRVVTYVLLAAALLPAGIWLAADRRAETPPQREAHAAPASEHTFAPLRGTREPEPHPFTTGAAEEGKAEVFGRILDADGFPCTTAALDFTTLDGTSLLAAEFDGPETGIDGRFAWPAPLDFLEGRRWALAVTAPDHVGRWIALPDPQTGVRVYLGDIRLAQRGLAISGRIEPPPEEGSRVTVAAVLEDDVPGESAPDARAHWGTVAAGGAFRVGGLVAGPHRLLVHGDDHGSVVEHVEAGRTDVVIRFDANPRPDAFRGTRVRVRVVGLPAGVQPQFRHEDSAFGPHPVLQPG